MNIIVQSFLNEHSAQLATAEHSQSEIVTVPLFHGAKVRQITETRSESSAEI
jgi:hypothetical protein